MSYQNSLLARRQGPMNDPSAEALFLGERSATADRGALVLAKEMAKAGHDPHSILQNTGWFQADNGAWNYEAGQPEAEAAYPSLRRAPTLRTLPEGVGRSTEELLGGPTDPFDTQHAIDVAEGRRYKKDWQQMDARGTAAVERAGLLPEERRASLPFEPPKKPEVRFADTPELGLAPEMPNSLIARRAPARPGETSWEAYSQRRSADPEDDFFKLLARSEGPSGETAPYGKLSYDLGSYAHTRMGMMGRTGALAGATPVTINGQKLLQKIMPDGSVILLGDDGRSRPRPPPPLPAKPSSAEVSKRVSEGTLSAADKQRLEKMGWLFGAAAEAVINKSKRR